VACWIGLRGSTLYASTINVLPSRGSRVRFLSNQARSPLC
jgi:hypothetical protein